PIGGSDGTTGVTAQLFEVAAGGTDGAGTVTLGALLDTSNTLDIPATADHPAVAAFDFGGDVTLAANTLYAVGFSTDGGATLADIRVGYTGGSTYAGGESYNAAGNATFATAFDVSIGLSNVPEPGSFALLGLGGMMLLRRRRA
ncbi:MAG: PEP-CTERM sorting domain-containing protein, partial [Phycisphaerales bacterium JB063]